VPVKSVAFLSFAILTAVAMPGGARAAELFGGLYVHDVKTPLDKAGLEGGMDVMIGWRGDRIGPTPLQPYAFGALNTSGETNYAAVGLSAKFGDKIFIRPGLGIAAHSGSAANHNRTDKIAFGSRVLFAPELGIGARINDRLSVEASWVHMSHGALFGRQNPGIDNIGMRLTLGL
jgi:hypothetical protein